MLHFLLSIWMKQYYKIYMSYISYIIYLQCNKRTMVMCYLLPFQPHYSSSSPVNGFTCKVNLMLPFVTFTKKLAIFDVTFCYIYKEACYFWCYLLLHLQRSLLFLMLPFVTFTKKLAIFDVTFCYIYKEACYFLNHIFVKIAKNLPFFF